MKNTFSSINLSANEAMLLQQVHEDGEDDVTLLSQQLGISRSRVSSLVSELKHKGLLIINHDYQGTWIRLSTKGSRLMNYLWPDAQLRAA